jgi:tetratricopeptide (TPR) repeat protein
MRRPSLLFTLLLLSLSARAQAPLSPKVIERYKQMLAANPVEGTALDRLWKMYAEQGQTGQLLDEYKADASFAAQMIRGHLLRRAGRQDEAIAAFESAAKLEPKNPLPALARAQLEGGRGHPREAAVAYEQTVDLLPPGDARLPETLLQLGAAWLDAGDIQKAAQAWEKTVALNPADLALRRRLAETYERNFLPDRAVEHLTYLETHAPATERPLALQQIARIHQGAGRQDAAIGALEKALALTGPGNWLRGELQSQIIRLHQRYHRTDELAARWKKFAEENPRDLGACLQLIELYERLGLLEEQRLWLTKLTTLAPKNVEYRVRLARLLLQMEATDAAVQLYDGLLKEQPANADFVFERARLDLQVDDTATAKQRITALLAARQNDETIRARALAFYEQNHLSDLVEQHLVADAAPGGEEALAALANFYFTQRREDEARRTLQRLVRATDPAAAQAAAHLRIAQLLRAQNDLDPAVTALRTAVDLQPENREAHLALGDLLAARGDYPGAQFAFEKAVRFSASEAERTEADQKLFESFRAQTAAAPARQGRPWMGFSPPGGDPNIQAPNPALDQFLLAIEREAIDQITEQTWLRVARWQLWNRNQKAALLAARRALTLDPKSVAGHELLVRIDVTLGQSSAAVHSLLKLASIDPANRASYERRAGQFELQAGRIPEALAIFEKLVADNPGNVDALTDLALTQQRAERWTEALETWRQVYALSPVSRRKESLTPLRRALERLNQHEESAALQLKALETEPGDRERLATFNELLTYCGQHGLIDWLRAQFEKRRQLRADDYFTEVALGRILKASGEAARAFEVLADASYAAPNQAEALPELIREAEELHKLDAAVKLQAQLLRILPQDAPDGLEKLAQLQEKNWEIDEAARTWERTVAKFPRDTTALNRAVEFQLTWGTPERALTLLRKARTLEPANLRTLSTLATLALEAGAPEESESCLEQILRLTPAEKTGDPLRFPALRPTEAGRLQTAYLATVGQRHGRPTPEAMRALRSFWVEETQELKGDREVRLNAIRQLAQISDGKGGLARNTWLARWQKEKAAPSESLWALFYAGAGSATLDRMEVILRENEKDQKAAQAFIWLALQAQQYERLGKWLQDKRRTPVERDFLFIALGQALDANAGATDPGLIDALFTEGTHLRLWQAAMLFAGRNRFREAITLGRRVFEQATTQRAVYGQELAHWHLFLGEIEPAREVLRTTISSTAESLDAPACSALREYYLLLAQKDRAAFVESYLHGLDAQRQPLHTALATVLLRGLAGQEAEARAALDRLIEMRAMAGIELGEPGTSGTRHLRFVLETGAQLQTLKLEHLAAYFWERALTDGALVLLQSDQTGSLARDIRQRLYALHAAMAAPGRMSAWVENYARVSPNDGVAALAGTLATMGAHARAIALFRQLWERTPEDAEAMRNLLNACRTAGDNETAEAALRACLRHGANGLPDGARREFVLQLADLQEHNGDLDGARTALDEALQNAPNDTRMLLRLGRLHTRAGRTEAAISILQRLLAFEPGNTAARLALSAAYETQGRLPDALAQLKSSASPDLSSGLAVFLLKTGQPEAAQAVVERLAPPQHISPALSLATAFAAQGDIRRARAVIHTALSRTDPRLSFPLQCKLIELLTAEDGPAAAQREMRRLRRFAGAGDNSPALLTSYLDFAAQQSVRLRMEKEFAAEVRALWADGTGPVAAGVTALTAQIEAGQAAALAPLLEQLLSRADAPDTALQTVAEALEKAGLRELLARVQERITQINPLNEKNALNLARTLHQLGRTDSARARLELLALRAALNEDSLGLVAQAFAEVGETDRALALYAQAARGDRFARSWATLLQYARLQSKRGDFAGAKQTLRTAFTHPTNRNFVEIIEWLVAAGRLDQAETEVVDFQLTVPRVVELRRALFGYFEKAGQPVNALALAETHPEIVQPALAPRLRQLAAAGRTFERTAKLLEKHAAQTEASGEFSLELARLLGDWAQAELAAGQLTAALAQLRRTHERHPELFEIASQLSTVLAGRGERKAAIETLESFLTLGKNAAEIEQARAQLAKLRAGG